MTPLFNLVDDACGWDPVKLQELDETTFNEFAVKYIEYCELREVELSNYLREENYYRTFLPLSAYTASTIPHLVWYYDEILLPDPLLHSLTDPSYRSKARQVFAAQAISFLQDIQSSIKSRYVLLTDKGTGIDLQDQEIQKTSTLILGDKKIKESFLKEVMILEKPSVLPGGENAGMLQLMANYTGWKRSIAPMGTYFPPGVLESGKVQGTLLYDFTSPFRKMPLSRLKKLGKADMLNGLDGTFSEDAKLVISSVETSKEISVPSLFVRSVDFDIAQHLIKTKPELAIGGPIDEMHIYKSILPYVNGISPESLMELRNAMPDAFKDFRGLVFRLYIEAKQKGLSGKETKAWIDQSVNSHLRKLETEMASIAKRFRIKGIGSVISIFKGSLSQPLDLAAEYEKEKTYAAANPAFFLWKAKKSK